MVNTIDSYQGVEKDVIIISNARTHGIGFLANYQRLNVALTRPRKCLILCGNFKNLEVSLNRTYNFLYNLIKLISHFSPFHHGEVYSTTLEKENYFMK